MSAHGDSHDHGAGAGHKHHPSVNFYLGIAVLLTAITAFEVGPLFELYNLPASVLLALSFVKFMVVVFLFMHLWIDELIYKKLFLPSLSLAVVMVMVVMALFHAYSREGQKAYMGPVREFVDPADNAKAQMDRLIAEAQAASAEHGGAAGGEHGAAGGEAGASAADGEAVFKANCVACHGPEGKGLVGPNLTDGEWLYGGTLADIENTVTNGSKKNAVMIAWLPVLGPEKVKAVSAYVHSLGGGQ